MAESSHKHPKGLYVLFGTEAAERFSFYTMRMLLVLYLSTVIFLDSFSSSEDYRKELGTKLSSAPADVFAAGTKDLGKEPKGKLDGALEGRKVSAEEAFLAAVKGQDTKALLDDAFSHVKHLDELFPKALASLEEGGRDFGVWVLARNIKRNIRDEALHVYGLYLLLVYLSGLLGGYFADRILGSRKAIIMGGIVMGIGLFVLANQDWIFYGLGLVVAGNGFFKPNISTIVSGLYEERDKRRDSAFTIFYMGINLGAFLAIFSGGYAESLADTQPLSYWLAAFAGEPAQRYASTGAWGWNAGFVFAGAGMILSLLLFLAGQKHLGEAGFPPNRKVDASSRLVAGDYRDIAKWAGSLVVLVVLGVASWTYVGPVWAKLPGVVQILVVAALVGGGIGWTAFGGKKGQGDDVVRLTKQELERIGVIVVISLFVIFFWAGFEQAGGTMNLFAYEQTDRHIGSWEMPATWFQGFNPIFIIILAIPFSWLWEWNDSKTWGLSTPAKMGLGMILLGIGFVVMYFGQVQADETGMAGLYWLVAVYLLHTIGELCLSPIGLSMVTKLSPVRVVSLMMGVWFACTAVADYLAGRLEYLVHKFEVDLWVFLIAISVGAGILLLVLTPLLKKWMHGRG